MVADNRSAQCRTPWQDAYIELQQRELSLPQGEQRLLVYGMDRQSSFGASKVLVIQLPAAPQHTVIFQHVTQSFLWQNYLPHYLVVSD